MANWAQYNALDSAIARVGGEVSDVLTRARDHFGRGKDDAESEAVLEAAKVLTDTMRALRHAIQDDLIKEKGYPR